MIRRREPLAFDTPMLHLCQALVRPYLPPGGEDLTPPRYPPGRTGLTDGLEVEVENVVIDLLGSTASMTITKNTTIVLNGECSGHHPGIVRADPLAHCGSGSVRRSQGHQSRCHGCDIIS